MKGTAAKIFTGASIRRSLFHADFVCLLTTIIMQIVQTLKGKKKLLLNRYHIDSLFSHKSLLSFYLFHAQTLHFIDFP